MGDSNRRYNEIKKNTLLEHQRFSLEGNHQRANLTGFSHPLRENHMAREKAWKEKYNPQNNNIQNRDYIIDKLSIYARAAETYKERYEHDGRIKGVYTFDIINKSINNLKGYMQGNYIEGTIVDDSLHELQEAYDALRSKSPLTPLQVEALGLLNQLKEAEIVVDPPPLSERYASGGMERIEQYQQQRSDIQQSHRQYLAEQNFGREDAFLQSPQLFETHWNEEPQQNFTNVIQSYGQMWKDRKAFLTPYLNQNLRQETEMYGLFVDQRDIAGGLDTISRRISAIMGKYFPSETHSEEYRFIEYFNDHIKRLRDGIRKFKEAPYNASGQASLEILRAIAKDRQNPNTVLSRLLSQDLDSYMQGWITDLKRDGINIDVYQS